MKIQHVCEVPGCGLESHTGRAFPELWGKKFGVGVGIYERVDGPMRGATHLCATHLWEFLSDAFGPKPKGPA